MSPQARAARSSALRMRQTVSLAAAAYGILAGQRERASALASQAEQLVYAIRAFLKAAGLAELLGEFPATETKGLGLDLAALQNELTDAYAEAALQWANAINNAEILGYALISDCQWDRVRILASALDECKRTSAAERLRTELRTAILEQQQQALPHIHEEMSSPQLKQALHEVRIVFETLRAHASDALGILPPCLDAMCSCLNKLETRKSLGWTCYPRSYQSVAQPTADEIRSYLDQLENALNRYDNAH
jgi:hypothetical protein